VGPRSVCHQGAFLSAAGLRRLTGRQLERGRHFGELGDQGPALRDQFAFGLGTIHLSDHPDSGPGHTVWVLLVAVLVIAVLLGVVVGIPRFRRLAASKIRPRLTAVWLDVRQVLRTPRKLVQLVGGAAASQLLVALALAASLRAFGDHLSLATLIIVITLASMIGGIAPVPGGMGVVEAGMILGLTAAGISESVPPRQSSSSDCSAHTCPALGLVHPAVVAPPRVCLTKVPAWLCDFRTLSGFSHQSRGGPHVMGAVRLTDCRRSAHADRGCPRCRCPVFPRRGHGIARPWTPPSHLRARPSDEAMPSRS